MFRENWHLKFILVKRDSDNSNADIGTLVSRVTFPFNMFYGSKTLFSFPLTKGYSPSILGMPCTQISIELLEAHKEQNCSPRTTEASKGTDPRTVPPKHLLPETTIWIYYHMMKYSTTKWVKATVVTAEEQ